MAHKDRNKKKIAPMLWLLLILMLTKFGVAQASEKTFTIGMVNHVSVHVRAFEGFKAGMAELGYVEGKTIKYIYNGTQGNDPKVVDAEIRNLLEQGVDLLVTGGNMVSLLAKQAVEGTDIPVLIAASSRPVDDGVVEDLSHPGGNLTGVQVADTMPKALEWLVKITPGEKKVYLPYNPDDQVSVTSLIGLDEVASQLRVELVFHEVQSVEEAVAAIETLPEDIGAIYRIPTPSLDPRNEELSRAAVKRRLPMVSVLPLDESVLLTLAVDLFDAGKQTARIAHQVISGIKPGDLPVETADPYLVINLRTAEKIGLEVPEDILIQAHRIIR